MQYLKEKIINYVHRKSKKCHLDFNAGFVRFNNFEINWSTSDWAIPFSYATSASGLRFYRFLYVSIITGI